MNLTRRTFLGTSALTLLVGCAAQAKSEPDSSIPAPAENPPQDATTANPPQSGQQEVAVEALTIMTTWNTTTDITQTDGDLRARPYFTDELAASIIAPERNAASGEWFAHPDSVSIPQIIPVEATDSLSSGSLAYEVSWNWQDAAGTTTSGEAVRLYNLAMINTVQGWKISDYTFEEFPRHH